MVARVVKIVLGVVLVAAGIAMLVLPGPGLLTIAGGIALILSQWPRGRRTLARGRVWLRERYGSRRVRRFEACLPNEVCPPHETAILRAVAEAEIPTPAHPAAPAAPVDPTDPPLVPRGA
jgi:hypothetical protein